MVSQQWGQVTCCPRTSSMGLRLQSRDGPLGPGAGAGARAGAAGDARPSRTIVNAKLALDPEFQRIDVQAKSAPVTRAMHLGLDGLGLRGAGAAVGDAEAPRRGGDTLFHGDARLDRRALAAGPCPEAALPGAGIEIGVVVGVGQALDAPFRTHLPVLALPVKNHGGARIGLEIATL